MTMHAVVEIMGHRTRAGVVSDATFGGGPMLRIEHPSRTGHDGDPLAEYYAPTAIFAIRPCSPEEAKAVADWAWAAETRTTPALGPALDHLVDEDEDGFDVFEDPF